MYILYICILTFFSLVFDPNSQLNMNWSEKTRVSGTGGGGDGFEKGQRGGGELCICLGYVYMARTSGDFCLFQV